MTAQEKKKSALQSKPGIGGAEGEAAGLSRSALRKCVAISFLHSYARDLNLSFSFITIARTWIPFLMYAYATNAVQISLFFFGEDSSPQWRKKRTRSPIEVLEEQKGGRPALISKEKLYEIRTGAVAQDKKQGFSIRSKLSNKISEIMRAQAEENTARPDIVQLPSKSSLEEIHNLVTPMKMITPFTKNMWGLLAVDGCAGFADGAYFGCGGRSDFRSKRPPQQSRDNFQRQYHQPLAWRGQASRLFIWQKALLTCWQPQGRTPQLGCRAAMRH